MSACESYSPQEYVRKKSKVPLILKICLGSAALHVTLLFILGYVIPSFFPPRSAAERPSPVKFRIVSDSMGPSRKMLEVKQEKTETPENAKYESFEDHKAKKQQRVASDDINRNVIEEASKKSQKEAIEKSAKRVEVENALSRLSPSRAKINGYKALLPQADELQASFNQGVQSFIDDSIMIGDAVDIDTTASRWMGYASHMRKAIEYVWIYPKAAIQRGFEGTAQVFFVIDRDGSVSRVRVIRTSGYRVLDDAIVEAIQMASPFPPLPESYEKEQLPMKGNFRYYLTSSYAQY